MRLGVKCSEHVNLGKGIESQVFEKLPKIQSDWNTLNTFLMPPSICENLNKKMASMYHDILQSHFNVAYFL